ncbi:hypothetical protein EVAR_95806_1 [Eumeta japonica]|uniref:Uncharacterized protein n=1 Tax=Eumeta variegata TaxID=151549 RepID=A0A4C1W4X1_EUMVA|nr:hypothetical protein EVAR_95806_1 [Eumeta japonica]
MSKIPHTHNETQQRKLLYFVKAVTPVNAVVILAIVLLLKKFNNRTEQYTPTSGHHRHTREGHAALASLPVRITHAASVSIAEIDACFPERLAVMAPPPSRSDDVAR